MKKLIAQLNNDKIKINRNKNPIKMDLFLSFLTVKTEVSTDHLGSYNGWTQRFNTELKLIISGGIVNGVNYLDSIQYGTKLDNSFNNYVNPFYLFDIMNDEGKKFFIEYYDLEIKKVLSEQLSSVVNFQSKLDHAEEQFVSFKQELKALQP